jgi:RecA/RadA recombinase
LAEADAIGLTDDVGEEVVTQTIARGLQDFSQPEVPDFSKDNSAINRRLVACSLSDIAPEKIEWLWPGRIAIGKLTLIAGEPGLGKSQITLQVAAAVTKGDRWPGNDDNAPSGSVIILSAEDGLADTTRPRFDAAGGDTSRVGVVRAIETKGGNGELLQSSFNLSSDLALLEAEIIRRGDVRLVIIDPVSSYMGNTDSHKNSDVRGVLEPIGNLAERLRVAVLGITHLSKGDGRAINRFIGSIAFIAAARAAFTVVSDPDDETGLRRLFLQVKNNIAPPAPGLAFRLEQREIGDGIIASAVAWDSSPVTVSADEALGALNPGSHTATDDAAEFLNKVLERGPVSAKEVERLALEAGLLGEGKPIAQCKSFRLARKRLGIDPVRTGGLGFGGQWIWSLPITTKMPSPPYDAPFSERGTLDTSGHLSGVAQ